MEKKLDQGLEIVIRLIDVTRGKRSIGRIFENGESSEGSHMWR